MADQKISAMTAAGALSGTEVVPGVQSAANVKITTAAIAALASVPSAANPTATASDAAVNGSATTFMRSDGAPAIQKATSGQFGLVKVDGTSVTAASGVISAVGVPYHPGFVSGRWYTRRLIAAIGNTTAVTASRLYAVPFYVPVSTTFTQAMARVQTAGAAATEATLAIYSNTSGGPNALEYTCGTVATDSTGEKTISSLSLALSAGWHWLAIGCSGTPTLYHSATSDYLDDLLGFAEPITTTAHFTGAYGAWTYSSGSPPSTFPALANGASAVMPLVFIGL